MSNEGFQQTLGERWKQREAEIEAMVDVVIATSDQHDEKCGCEGEACKVGDALAKLDAIRGMRV